MVCRNQELFTNNCNHGNERLFHINVCDANRKTVENIATRQSKLCEFVIREPVVACSVAVGSTIVGSFVIGVGSVVICSLLQLTNVCQHIFNVRRISYKQIPGMESPQCHFQNWGSPTRVEWKGLLSKFLVFSQKLYYSKLWHILDL